VDNLWPTLQSGLNSERVARQGTQSVMNELVDLWKRTSVSRIKFQEVDVFSTVWFERTRKAIISAERLVVLPELRPRHAWGTAKENIGMIVAFLIMNAVWIRVMGDKAT